MLAFGALVVAASLSKKLVARPGFEFVQKCFGPGAAFAHQYL